MVSGCRVDRYWALLAVHIFKPWGLYYTYGVRRQRHLCTDLVQYNCFLDTLLSTVPLYVPLILKPVRLLNVCLYVLSLCVSRYRITTPCKVGRFTAAANRDATDTVNSLEVFTTFKHFIGRNVPRVMTNMQIVKQLQVFTG